MAEAPSPSSSSNLPPPPPPPKILLAKPSPLPSIAALDSTTAVGAPPSSSAAGVVLRSSRNAPQPGSLNLFSSDSWDIQQDRILPFLTENTDFNVIGIIGPTGVGKSTILNELYGFDGSSPGMLPPFAVQSDETRAMEKHCTVGVELRVSAERLILLDVQPMFSSSVLLDMMRPDGSSTFSVLNGETLSADLAHELLGIQLGIFLASVCNVLLVLSEGVHDFSMWKLMLTVDLLKHGIPDPSILTPSQSQHSSASIEKDDKMNLQVTNEDHLAAPVFIHTRLRDRDLSPCTYDLLKRGLSQYFKSSSFNKYKLGVASKEQVDSNSFDMKSTEPDLFLLPIKREDDMHKPLFGSYNAMLGQLRDQVLSMNGCSFAKNVSERDWLRNSAKIWELVKKSPAISDYCKMLRKSGLFRR